ncbi:MAG TPA: RNase P subunit p30 family protein [Bacillota bacterium]|nr:RNase P subunit p30 family protein [Bacillota bacterium]
MKQIIIRENNFQKARKKIKENSGKIIVFASSDDELNRKMLEKEKIDILLPDLSKRKDKMKQRDSGFNHVLARLAKNKNISLGIDFDEITNSKPKEKSEILARIRQNIKLCNKNKINMKFISSKKEDRYNLKSLGLLLGMPTNMVKNL